MIDSLDEHGEEAFHPFYPAYMLDKARMDRTKWVHSYNYYPIKTVSLFFHFNYYLNCHCYYHSIWLSVFVEVCYYYYSNTKYFYKF